MRARVWPGGGCTGSDYYELVWKNPRLVLQGLDASATYQLTRDNGALDLSMSGAVLMSAGVPIVFSRDGASLFYELNVSARR